MIVLFTLFTVWVIIEVIGFFIIGTYYIRGNGIELLKKELNKKTGISKSMIHLSGVTELKGEYLSKTYLSFIFPYYVSCERFSVKYPILRYSKAYYLVKDEFREYKKNRPF